PMGTVYFDITRHRRLFGREALNAMIVKPAKVDREALKKMRPLHTYSGSELVARITGQMDKERGNILAMRWMIVLAALIAVGGILATSVLARRREWGVLRAVGMGRARLLLALAIEIALILMLGATIGAIGGIITFEGPIVSFMDHQGFTIGREIVLLPLVGTAALAIAVGLVAVTVSALMVSRTKLTEALSYE
ncbi:MAG: ABC transporter permease, partial [Thermoleophilia bacterium]|nr:ABC transporter permease [Thermoleophilia bacterium]